MLSLACQTAEPAKPGGAAGGARAPASSPAPAAAPPPQTPPVAPPVTTPSTPSAASADGSLAFFQVRGVAPDDTLNIRSQPDSNAPSLGTIAAGTTRVEGIGAATLVGSARWQRVRHAGSIGWVNARFLSPDESAQPAAPASGAEPGRIALLVPLICFGTEPFWAIRFGADGSASCEAMCEGPPGLRVAQLGTSAGGEPESFDLLGADGSVYLRAALRKTDRCSDGMSDLLHPYEFTSVGAPGALTGCCRVEKASPPEPRP